MVIRSQVWLETIRKVQRLGDYTTFLGYTRKEAPTTYVRLWRIRWRYSPYCVEKRGAYV